MISPPTPNEAGILQTAERISTLSPREREIFDWYGRGLTKHEIAAQLKLSIHTVEGHRGNIIHKLGLCGYGTTQKLAVLANEHRYTQRVG